MNSLILKLFIGLMIASLCLIIFFNYLSIYTIQSTRNHMKSLQNTEQSYNLEFEDYLKFNMQPSSLHKCNNISANKFIFVYVFVRVEHFERRDAIRATWANKRLFSFLNVAFVIGLSTNQSEVFIRKLNQEQADHADLIQGNFIDSYKNLSYKSLLAWEWIADKCSNAKYILKIDDDVVLNTFNLRKFLKDESKFVFSLSNFEKLKNTFICRVVPGDNVCRDKNTCGKVYASEKEYNEKLYGLANKYGRFCSGVAVLMTPDLVSNLLMKASQIKLFFIDDVYVGIVGRYAEANFIQLWNKYIVKKELDILTKYSDILFVRDADSLSDIYFVWNTLRNRSNSQMIF
jgi:hypothetical protein